MKKTILAVTATLFSSFIFLQAQETHFGIKGGLNLASLQTDQHDRYDTKAGFHVGGLAHIHLSKQFAVQPEVMFSQQGARDGEDFKFKLNYINVPVLAQYMFNNGFRLETGPQVGFLVSAETENGDIEEETENTAGIDFSWTVGAGYLFPSGFGVDARYNFGFTNIYDNDVLKEKNRVFQVGLFYQFMHNQASKRK